MWLVKNIQCCFSLKKSGVVFTVSSGVIVHLAVDQCRISHDAFGWMGAESVALYTSEFILILPVICSLFSSTPEIKSRPLIGFICMEIKWEQNKTGHVSQGSRHFYPENGGTLYKMSLIPKEELRYFVKTSLIIAESLFFNHIILDLFQTHCACVRRQKDTAGSLSKYVFCIWKGWFSPFSVPIVLGSVRKRSHPKEGDLWEDGWPADHPVRGVVQRWHHVLWSAKWGHLHLEGTQPDANGSGCSRGESPPADWANAVKIFHW